MRRQHWINSDLIFVAYELYSRTALEMPLQKSTHGKLVSETVQKDDQMPKDQRPRIVLRSIRQ